MLFWQKAFKSIAYGDFQSTTGFFCLFASERKWQMSAPKGDFFNHRHEGIWLGTKVALKFRAYVCVDFFIVITTDTVKAM